MSTPNSPKSPAAKGLSAILRGAAPGDQDDLERDMKRLIEERNRNARDLDHIPTAEIPRPPPIPYSRPEHHLTPDAQLLISKGIINSAEQSAREALDASNKYLEDAERLTTEVRQWGEQRVREARDMASLVAERHAALLRARPLFHQAMNGEGAAAPQPLDTQEEPLE